MENEEKIRRDARRRLEEQLKQYRVQRQKERVSVPQLKCSFTELILRLKTAEHFVSSWSKVFECVLNALKPMSYSVLVLMLREDI